MIPREDRGWEPIPVLLLGRRLLSLVLLLLFCTAQACPGADPAHVCHADPAGYTCEGEWSYAAFPDTVNLRWRFGPGVCTRLPLYLARHVRSCCNDACSDVAQPCTEPTFASLVVDYHGEIVEMDRVLDCGGGS